MKINLFHKYNLPINETIEYIYFALATFTLGKVQKYICICCVIFFKKMNLIDFNHR